ncbi:MAG: hypothetical protein AB7O97_02765 [Planctomycetota bacterium]
MNVLLGFLAGAACTAVIAVLAARRRARLFAAAAAAAEQERRSEARAAAVEARDRRAAAVARIQTVVTNLRRQLDDALAAAAAAEEAAAKAHAMAAEQRIKAAAAAEAADTAALTEPEADAAILAARELVCALEPEPKTLAQALSHELANIVSGIEGGTFRLIEAVPMLRARSDAVEILWLSVRRLRRFHDKVRAFVQSPETDAGTTPIEPLLLSLRSELDATELGLQMAWSLPRALPVLRGSIDELLSALVFVSTALQKLERGALRLSIHVEPCFDGSQPETRLELDLERDEMPGRLPEVAPPSAAFLIARRAAQNQVRGLGGSLRIEHEPGHAARAVVRLPAARPEEGARPAAVEVPQLTDVPLPLARSHRYGGALLIESDPNVRSMLASELKAAGRAVFACADGAAARSLIQATPDRFEMLIVDNAARLDAGDLLAATAARLCPELKVFVLSDVAEPKLPADLAARVHRIRKPFGVQELRRALAAAFAE